MQNLKPEKAAALDAGRVTERDFIEITAVPDRDVFFWSDDDEIED